MTPSWARSILRWWSVEARKAMQVAVAPVIPIGEALSRLTARAHPLDLDGYDDLLEETR